MSLQDIKFNSQNPNGYIALATRAAEMERQGLWEQAMHMWVAAKKVAKKDQNVAWAQCRVDYCCQARAKSWCVWRAAA